MKYFKLEWLLLIAFLVCIGDISAAPKRRAKPKKFPIKLPKININIHHNSKFYIYHFNDLITNF